MKETTVQFPGQTEGQLVRECRILNSKDHFACPLEALHSFLPKVTAWRQDILGQKHTVHECCFALLNLDYIYF